MHELTTAITFSYFDANLKEYIGYTLKIREIIVKILNFSVTWRISPDPPSPEIFVTVCHRSHEPPPSPSTVTYLLNGPFDSNKTNTSTQLKWPTTLTFYSPL